MIFFFICSQHLETVDNVNEFNRKVSCLESRNWKKNMHTQNRLINNNDHMISFIYKSRKHLRNIRQMPWEDPKYGN